MRWVAALITVCAAGCAGWDERPVVPANPPLAARDLAVVDPPAREPAGMLSPREIHRDLEVLMFALRAYDPHGMPGGILGDLMPRDLPPLAKRPITAGELCRLIADRLQWNHPQPKVVVSRATGERCISFYEIQGDKFGRQSPAGDRAFTLETRTTAAGPVAVLAVNRFDARDRDAWQELPRALAAVESGGLIVDLRQVGGTDPTGGMLIARLLAGRNDVSPVRGVHAAASDVAEVLRANRRRRLGTDDTTPPPWAAPVETPVEAIRVPRDRRVIVDQGCREACVVTAIALRRRAGAEILGRLSVPWAEGARPGLVVLPNSAIQVEIPTTTVDLGDWAGLGAVAYVPGTDLLARALTVMDGVLAARARVARWLEHDPPPLCADPERLSEDQLPKAAIEKFDFFDFHRISRLSTGRRVGVLAVLSVGPDQAARLLAACPGVNATRGIETSEGETIVPLDAPKEVLYRLANSDVVVRIEL